MPKRKRSLSDVICHLDSLLAATPKVELPDIKPARLSPVSCFSQGTSNSSRNSDSNDNSNRSVGSDENDSITAIGTGHTRAVSRMVDEFSEPRRRASPGSTFEIEINFFRREEEDIADMCLYLAETVSSARTPEALLALVRHFEEHGTETVMQSLKRAGLQSRLLCALCRAQCRNVTAGNEFLLIRFVAHLLSLCDDEVLCDIGLVNFFLRNSEQQAAERPVPATGIKHWSQMAKCCTPLQKRCDDISALKTAIDDFCGGESDSTTTSLALRALMHVVFRYNQATALPGESNPCLVFANLGGFETLTRMLERAECKDALHLLEVVTLCEQLSISHKTSLCALVTQIVRFITHSGTHHERDVLTVALRVLVNGTSLVPQALCDSIHQRERSDLAAFVAERLMDPNTPLNMTALILCSAVNVVKWEASSSCGDFCGCLVGFEDFLSRVAELTILYYNADETERNVVSGYYALLLAVLSLVDTPKLKLRVPVITAVAMATRGTRTGKAVESRPMKLIVAILQEFLLFQSQAGSLTKSGLLSMSTIIESVVKRNGIEISADH